ncbi:DUF1835 domain-containing protein [Sabulilitoribacter arenilitoris]|uniref:DUF1835 domain-containing protein n=1 Tax=Wocania arenilitoris TaxID=2044858 RepID=A0AAE3EPD7_9FLAO|nr:DUF1835 domain-containing protein [Wocania arenilitoris]MCF7568587.1 DUF1835 domain-containing protein [Wocania arenilitoris]
MAKKTLHITNGDSLTDYLNELDITGEKLTWQEMLCEGSTQSVVGSDAFLNLRTTFLKDFYDIELDIDELKKELNKLNNPEKYSEIVLWFEYDLFCHINMMAVISMIQQQKIELPIYLVCSGRIPGEKNLKGLSELTTEQLLNHYKNKVKLKPDDIQLVVTLWGIYCGKDHNLFKPYIIKSSTFKYLSNCLKAHLERFPDHKSGLNILERNILEIIKDNTIKSKNHLLGYAINYQGYYGYGDLQLSRIIEELNIFFNEKAEGITLNRKGHEALLGTHNFSSELHNNMVFGGVNKFNFQFNSAENKLVKTISNAY